MNQQSIVVIVHILICCQMWLDTINSHMYCYTSGGSTCTSSSLSDYGSIYCHDETSCEYKNIQSTGGHIHCLAQYSCRSDKDDSSYSSYYLSANDYLWCEGPFSCYDNQIRYSTGTYCQGFASCAYSAITSVAIAGCRSLNSCYYTEITSVAGVYCYAMQACMYALMADIATIVECIGEKSCYGSTISGFDSTNSLSIACDAINACQMTTLSNINTIDNYGVEGISDSSINNAILLNDYAFEYGLYSSTLTDVEVLNVYSGYCLQYATINNGDLGNMTVNLYGAYSGINATINCYHSSLDDLCIINCLSETACIGLTVYCNLIDTCHVNCDPVNNIACPKTHDATTTDPTVFPSSMPTILPTKIPSYLPSDQPTHEPTNGPTKIPSYLPSDQPTDSTAPSNHPSEQPSHGTAPSSVPTALPDEFTTIIEATQSSAVQTSPAETTATVTKKEDCVQAVDADVDIIQCVNAHSEVAWTMLSSFVLFIVSLIINTILCTKLYCSNSTKTLETRKVRKHPNGNVDVNYNIKKKDVEHVMTQIQEHTSNEMAKGNFNDNNVTRVTIAKVKSNSLIAKDDEVEMNTIYSHAADGYHVGVDSEKLNLPNQLQTPKSTQTQDGGEMSTVKGCKDQHVISN